MRTRFKLAGLVLAVALVAAACGKGGSTGGSTGAAKSGGHITIGTISNIDSLNPFVTFQQNSYAAFEYIYPQLIQINVKTLQYEPDFALKWEKSSDGLVWTFHTVPNA